MADRRYIWSSIVCGEIDEVRTIDIIDRIIGHNSHPLLFLNQGRHIITDRPLSRAVCCCDVEVLSCPIIKPEIDRIDLGDVVKDAGIKCSIAGTDAEVAVVNGIIQEVLSDVWRSSV